MPDNVVTIPSGFTDALLYAPTTLPHGGSCIEVTMIHWNSSYWGGPDHGFGIWDWCNHATGGFQVLEDMSTSTWKSKYRFGHTRFGGGGDEYVAAIAIYADSPNAEDFASDCWHAIIWNVSLQAWEQKYTSCGVSHLAQSAGWTMHESLHMQGYYSPACPTLRSVAADALWYYQGSTITRLTPPSVGDGSTAPYSYGYCYNSSTWNFYETYNYWYGWQAMTPTTAF